MPVDYAKLAAKHGGEASAAPAVDYAALAAKHGGTEDNRSVVHTTPNQTAVPSPPARLTNYLPSGFDPMHPISNFAGNVKDMPSVFGNVGIGAAKGLLHTISGADDWANKHLPAWMSTPIGQTPSAENAAKATAYAKQLATPQNNAQRVGRNLEQAGEFMIPGGAEERIGASVANGIARVAPRLAKAAPIAGKVAASALGSGLANKAQGGTLKGGAAAGAGGTLLGAGVSAMMPTLQSLKMAGSKILAPGSVGETLVRATKPAVKFGPAGEIGQSLESALPKSLEQNPNISGVSDLGVALDSATEHQGQQYSDVVAPYRKPSGEGPYRSTTIDGNPIADAQNSSIPAMNAFEDQGSVPSLNPFNGKRIGTSKNGIIGRTENIADSYRKEIPVPQLDDIRIDANQKLNAFYNKQGGDQAAALSNPETARVKAVGDTTRQVLYPVLDEGAGLAPGSVADMQNMFGKLSDASNIANKRSLVFGRQDPVSLSEKLAVGHGGPVASTVNFLKEQAIKRMTNSDGLVQSAIDRLQNPGGPLRSLDFNGLPTLSAPSNVGSFALGSGMQFGRADPSVQPAINDQQVVADDPLRNVRAVQLPVLQPR